MIVRSDALAPPPDGRLQQADGSAIFLHAGWAELPPQAAIFVCLCLIVHSRKVPDDVLS